MGNPPDRRAGDEDMLQNTSDAAAEPAAEAARRPPALSPADALIGKLAVKLRMLTPEQLEQGVKRFAATPDRPLGDVLLDAGLLTRPQLEFLLATKKMQARRQADRKFGDLAIQQGLASREQLNDAMNRQKQLFVEQRQSVLVGDLLIEQGVLTLAQRDALLQQQGRLHTPRPPEPATGLPTEPPAEAKHDETGKEPAHGMASAICSLSADRMQAFITLSEGTPPDRATIDEALKYRKVVHGILDPSIATLLSGDVPAGKPCLVAQGDPVRPGRDAEIEYLFETRPLLAGRETEDGRFDFRDRGEIVQVEAGALLARKTPAEPGEPGTDVTGREVKPDLPKDPAIQAGKGVALSEDGLLATAIEGGRPALTATGALSVHQEFRVEKDVDLTTGHIDYHGLVVVPGTVQPGFRVRCGQLVAREIAGADIDVRGDIRVNGGIIASRVRSEGSVKARYLQKSHVDALGDVLIDKEIVESEISCSGALLSERATLLGSRVSAKLGAFLRTIGSESSAPCRLTVGVDETVERSLARLQAAHQERQAELESNARETAAAAAKRTVLEQRIGEQAQSQERLQKEQRALRQGLSAIEQRGTDQESRARQLQRELERLETQAREADNEVNALLDEQDVLTQQIEALTETRNALQTAIAELDAERETLRQWSGQNPGLAVVEAVGEIVADTVVKTPHTENRFTSRHKNVRLELHERRRGEEEESEWVLDIVTRSRR